MTTGERIKQCRKRLGMSAEKLAKKISVSPATVYRWEKGDIEKVPGQILEPLADALQTTPQYLMGWEEDEPKTDSNPGTTIQIQHPETRILAHGFEQLPEADRKKALEMMNLMFGSRFAKGNDDHDDDA